MDNFDYPAIGQRIKQLRKRKELNQTELAQMLKKSLRTVQKYETGENGVSLRVDPRKGKDAAELFRLLLGRSRQKSSTTAKSPGRTTTNGAIPTQNTTKRPAM